MDLDEYKIYEYYTSNLFNTFQEIILKFKNNFEIKYIFYIEDMDLYFIQIITF